MKRLFITLLVVVIGSLTMLGQTLSIMKIGEEILSKNNFLSAKQIVKQRGMKISEFHQTSFEAYMELENGDFLNSIYYCFVNAVSKTNKRIKIVRFYFFCGSNFHYRLTKDLENMNYIKIGRTIDGIIPETGTYVIQSEYSKDTYHCIVRYAPSNGVFEINLERKK